MSNPKRFVLTGGPCAGKTSSLKKIQNMLNQQDYNTFVVPEAARILAKQGANTIFSSKIPDACYIFQKQLMQLQLLLEDQCYQVAKEMQNHTTKTSIILIDRGLFDGKAYCDDDTWQRLLQNFNITHEQIIKRYDGVIHLETAAIDARTFYGKDSNQFRTETPEEAIEKDISVLEIWREIHPLFTSIKNKDCNSFCDKIDRILSEIKSLL